MDGLGKSRRILLDTITWGNLIGRGGDEDLALRNAGEQAWWRNGKRRFGPAHNGRQERW